MVNRLSLGARLFLLTGLLVAGAVGVAVGVTSLVGRRVAADTLERTLTRSAEIQAALHDARLQRLRLSTVSLTAPEFTAYVAEAMHAGETLSITDQLGERRPEYGFEIALVIDADGKVVVDTSDPRSGGEDLSQDPLIVLANEEFQAAGVWLRGGHAFDAVALPMAPAGILEGFLVLGYSIEDASVLEMKRVTGADVAMIATGAGAPTVVASTLDDRTLRPLVDLVASKALTAAGDGEGSGAGVQSRELGPRRWAILGRPLVGADGQAVGIVASLAPLDEELAPFRRINGVLALVGLAAVLLTLGASFVFARRLLQPVRALAVAAQAAAQGRYDQEIPAESKDEIGRLAGAFRQLLSELREQRDMETYITELSRNLPDGHDGAAGPGTASPPRSRQVVLVAAETRPSGTPVPEDPIAALDQLGRELQKVVGAFASHRGSLEAVLGHRVVASFEGKQAGEQALWAAADALTSAESPDQAPSVVVAVGRLVSGSVTWHDRAREALTGDAADQLEALGRVARPGTALLTAEAFAAVKHCFADAKIELPPLKTSVVAMPVHSFDVAQASALAVPDIAATQAMTGATTPMATPTFSAVAPGGLLGGRFEILSVLGAGGMGIVYKARDRTLDELVAVKMIKQQMTDGSGQLERLKDELRVARKITHPNVLRTFDFGEMNGYPFISMEYVRGVTLRQLLDQSGRLPLSAGLRIARQLCRGLAAAHQQGILHRDIKPENLIIEHTGNAKLMDFGIAERVQRKRETGQPGVLVGTPFYLAPEQLQGLEADERADLYAAGMVFYEVFTGRLPYEAKGNLMAVIQEKLSKDPDPPRSVWPAMPEKLEQIIVRCLARDRTARYADVGSLLTELEGLRA